MRDKLKQNLRIAAITIICIVIFGYTYYEARFLIDGPQLTINSPQNNATVSDPLLVITGTAENLTSMTINGRNILIRPDGTFDDKLLLLNGYNTIETKVRNKFGQEASKILEIMLLPKTQPA